MDKKVCFKCKVEKPITDFYVHKQMGDGHLGKCKECAKSDVKMKYEQNIENPEYVEKERARGREKYHRLQYKNKYTKEYMKGSENSNRKMKHLGIDMYEKESHHWCYNKEYKNDVFILGRRAHKLVHKFLQHDPETNCFIIKETGIKITTKQQHYEFILSVFKKSNVNYEIESFPEMLNL